MKDKHDISDIFQGDSNDTIASDDTVLSDSSNDTVYDTDNEVESDPVTVNLTPIQGQVTRPGQPVEMNVNMNNNQKSSSLPLCMMLNARSVYNKADHFKDLYQLGPDIILVSENLGETVKGYNWHKPVQNNIIP